MNHNEATDKITQKGKCSRPRRLPCYVPRRIPSHMPSSVPRRVPSYVPRLLLFLLFLLAREGIAHVSAVAFPPNEQTIGGKTKNDGGADAANSFHLHEDDQQTSRTKRDTLPRLDHWLREEKVLKDEMKGRIRRKQGAVGRGRMRCLQAGSFFRRHGCAP